MTHENVDRLRFEIDSGRTGDKVAGSDPAAAPLGTDEEAAGTPIPPHAIGQARALEGSRPHEARPDHGPGHAWILIGFVLACAAALLTWAAVLSARPAKPVADGPSGSGLRSLGDAYTSASLVGTASVPFLSSSVASSHKQMEGGVSAPATAR